MNIVQDAEYNTCMGKGFASMQSCKIEEDSDTLLYIAAHWRIVYLCH